MNATLGIWFVSVARIWRKCGIEPHRIETFEFSTHPVCYAGINLASWESLGRPGAIGVVQGFLNVGRSADEPGACRLGIAVRIDSQTSHDALAISSTTGSNCWALRLGRPDNPRNIPQLRARKKPGAPPQQGGAGPGSQIPCVPGIG